MDVLYQVNTRVVLKELSATLSRAATLDDIPDSWLDEWKSKQVDSVWLLSVWEISLSSRQVSRTFEPWQDGFHAATPGLVEEDIEGSGFAIASYSVSQKLGGSEALARLRVRLASRDIRMVLDFVPNHMGLDHRWLNDAPEFFVSGTEELLEREPDNFFRHEESGRVFAHGRDPHFSGWPDTVQLDYSSPALLRRMTEELVQISRICDGVRCDMAMLMLPDIYERTWGRPALPFWEEAIKVVKESNPGFTFLAEVYWDREWDLMELGFDYCYDKRLYDRLLFEDVHTVRAHLVADVRYQTKLARFLENHDEARIASVVSTDRHFAAAIITYLTPGLKFFHEGQWIGRRAKITPHVTKRPDEPSDTEIVQFYDQLLTVLPVRYFKEARWLLLETKEAWAGNPSHDRIIAFRWKDLENRHLLVFVNYSNAPAQCRVRVNIDRNCVSEVCLRDLFTGVVTNTHKGTMLNPGLTIELEPWAFKVFEEVDS